MKAAWLALFLAGCASSNVIVSMSPPSPPPKAKDYVDQIKRWTRHGDMRYDFDATLIVDATMHSPEFSAAFAAKYIDVYKVTDSARDQVTASLRVKDEEGWVFHVETQAHTYELTELKSSKTIWRITLIDDRGREVATSAVVQDPSRPEVLQTFYPYDSTFSRAFRLVFPRKLPDGSDLIGPDTAFVTLRIAGPPGSIDLVWRMRPPEYSQKP